MKTGAAVRAIVAGLAAGGMLPLLPTTVEAACTVNGSGTIDALDSGDLATCTGMGNTDLVNATGRTNVGVQIGNGPAPASLTPAAGTPAIVFDNTSSSFISFGSQASVSANAGAILLSNGSTGISVSVGSSAGSAAVAESTGNAEAAIVIDNANSNSVIIYGSVLGTGGNTSGVRISGTSSSNLIDNRGVISGGFQGIQLIAGDNVIENSGAISGGFDAAIQGSSGTDTVVNSGTITGGGQGAIKFSGGADRLVLLPGSTITGLVLGGAGTDALRFSGNGSASFNLNDLGAGQQYDEFEILEKSSSSIWTLTGTTTFNGATMVSNGGLVVNGTLPSVVTVDGGFVGGSGTIGGLVANNTGTVAPGNSIGTMNVNGNVTFNAGSIYQVEINGTGQSDKIAATGTATLNGGTVQIVPLGTGFKANIQYTILAAAGGVSGTFSSLAPLSAPLVAGQLTYDSHNVYFLLQQIAAFSSLGATSGLTPNQAAVANTLDQATLSGSASAPLTNAINTLMPLSESGIKSGLNDLAGQINADGRRFTADVAGGFQNFMLRAGTQFHGEAVRVTASPVSSYAPVSKDPIGAALKHNVSAPAPSVWFGGYGNWDRVSTTATAFGTNTRVGGAALGADLWATPTFVGGVSIGASTAALRSSGRNDKVDADTGHVGLYARGEAAGVDIASAVSYAFTSLESSRSISYLQQTATGDWHANTFAASLGFWKPYQVGTVVAAPFANLDWYATRHGSFAETGAPGVNQIVQSGNLNAVIGTAGVRLYHQATWFNMPAVRLGATLGVRHDFTGTAPSMTAVFDGAAGIPFVIGGVDRPSTAAVVGGEASWALSTRMSFRASYEGDFASALTRHTVQGAFRWQF